MNDGSFTGIFLISSVLALNTIWEANSANHLPAMVFIPTFTATAWYHNMLEPALQAKTVEEVVAEAEAWVLDEYTVALAKGERLSEEETEVAAVALAKYTGLTVEFVKASNLRIDDGQFRKELLRKVRHIAQQVFRVRRCGVFGGSLGAHCRRHLGRIGARSVAWTAATPALTATPRGRPSRCVFHFIIAMHAGALLVRLRDGL